MADGMPRPVLAAAVAERDNTRRLITVHVATCQEPRLEPGSLAGTCDQCRSLARHLARCERQVDLLTVPDTEAMFDG